MEINKKYITETECEMTLTLQSDEVNQALEKTIKELGKDLNIDGFRKGKIPKQVIQERFGSKITQNATSNLVEDSTKKALDEHKLYPITDLNFKFGEEKSIQEDKDFNFSFSFEILPSIETPSDFEAIQIHVTEPMLTPIEMQTIMTNVQKRYASLKDKESDEIKNGDVVLVDVLVSDEGKAISSMSAKNLHFQISEQSSLPELNNFLLKMKKGQDLKDSMKIPAGYPDPSLRGKEVEVSIHVYSIHTEILPPVDDALAKKAGFDNLEKLQKQLFYQSMNNKMLLNKTDAQNKLLEDLLKDMEFSIPTCLIQSGYASYMEDVADTLGKKGLDKEAIQTAMKTLHDEATKDATKRAKSQAFLMAIGLKENLSVTDKDVMKFVENIAKENKQDFKKLYEHIWRSGMIMEIKNQILSSKALDYVYNKVKKIVVDIHGKPVEIPQQSTKA